MSKAPRIADHLLFYTNPLLFPNCGALWTPFLNLSHVLHSVTWKFNINTKLHMCITNSMLDTVLCLYNN